MMNGASIAARSQKYEITVISTDPKSGKSTTGGAGQDPDPALTTLSLNASLKSCSSLGIVGFAGSIASTSSSVYAPGHRPRHCCCNTAHNISSPEQTGGASHPTPPLSVPSSSSSSLPTPPAPLPSSTPSFGLSPLDPGGRAEFATVVLL